MADTDDPLDKHRPPISGEANAWGEEYRRRRRRKPTLSPREAEFVMHYLGGKTPVEAMIHAGYDVVTPQRALDVMRLPLVEEAIAKHLDAATEAAQVNSRRIIGEHAAMAFSDPVEALEALKGDEGFSLEGLRELPSSVTRAIRKVKVSRRYEGKGEDRTPVDTLELEMHDKHKSLDALAKATKLYRDDAEEEAISSFGALLREALTKRGLD